MVPSAGWIDDHRLLDDLVRSEVLAGLSAGTCEFLMRTSVLDRLSGPLCDAVLADSGSQRMLELLEQRNLLIVPLDRRRSEYRYHRLFREILHAELVRTEPDLVRLLHARRATWFDDDGQLELALGHAQTSADTDRAARLVCALGQRTISAGRVATIRTAIRWFDASGVLERHPDVAVTASWIEAGLGMPDAAARYAATVELTGIDTAMAAINRANLAANGLTQMRTDAQTGCQRLAPSSPLKALALALEGVATYLAGEPDLAETLWIRAGDAAADLGAPVAGALVAAMRSVLAFERDGDDADTHSTRALEIVESAQLHDDGHSALVFAVAARVAIRRGDIGSARGQLARAARLRPLLTSAIPWTAVHLVQLGHASLELGDRKAARAIVRDIAEILRLRRALGVIATQAAELRDRIANDRRRTDRSVLDHPRRAPSPPVPRHPPVVPTDRGAPRHLAVHRQVAGRGHVPQARRELTQ